MIRFTQTGLLLFGISVLLYFASITSQSSLLLVPIGILLGCYLVNFFSARKTVKGLDVQSPRSSQLTEGERMSQPWKIHNKTKSPAGLVQIDSDGKPVLSLGYLAPQSVANLVPELAFARRGVYNYSQTKLSSSYPFGLIRATRRFELPGEIIVHPAVYPTTAPRAAGYDVMIGGKFKGKRRVTSGTNFAGVRPFQPGDTLKQIHWKSSAKGIGLMVKTFEEELSGRTSIIMDGGHNGDARTFDDCVRATGSLIFAALDAGNHIEWIDVAHQQLLLIPPFADGHEILDRLAKIKEQSGCLTPEKLQKVVERISNRSAISFVLTDVNEAARAAISALQQQRRIISVYLPVECKAEIPGVPLFRYDPWNIVEEK